LAAYDNANRSVTMPNIENLKKQAKLYLRWHRDRRYPVAAQISSVLGRFRGLPDRAVLDSDFKFSDAQELVARKSSFESWPALISGIETMSASEASAVSTSVILAAEPQLFVSDMDAACDFHACKLDLRSRFLMELRSGRSRRSAAELEARCRWLALVRLSACHPGHIRRLLRAGTLESLALGVVVGRRLRQSREGPASVNP
jgi:hypothetical protein